MRWPGAVPQTWYAVLRIEQERTGDGYAICRPVGELDASTVSQFRHALAELAARPFRRELPLG